jgi:hypothetical protein
MTCVPLDGGGGVETCLAPGAGWVIHATEQAMERGTNRPSTDARLSAAAATFQQTCMKLLIHLQLTHSPRGGRLWPSRNHQLQNIRN